MKFDPNTAISQSLASSGFTSSAYHIDVTLQGINPNKTILTPIDGTTPEALLAAVEKHGFAGKVINGQVEMSDGDVYRVAKKMWLGQKQGFAI